MSMLLKPSHNRGRRRLAEPINLQKKAAIDDWHRRSSVTIEDWCIRWRRKALLAVEAVVVIIGAGTCVEEDPAVSCLLFCWSCHLIVAEATHFWLGHGCFLQLLPQGLLPRALFFVVAYHCQPFCRQLEVCWRSFCCRFFLRCHLSGSPGDSKCLRYRRMILSSRTAFSWCEDFFIDAAFLIWFDAWCRPSHSLHCCFHCHLYHRRHLHVTIAIADLLSHACWTSWPPPSLVLPAHFSSNPHCCWCFLPHMCSRHLLSFFHCCFWLSRTYNSLVGAPCMDNQIEQLERIFDLRECCFLNEEWFLFFIFLWSIYWLRECIPPILVASLRSRECVGFPYLCEHVWCIAHTLPFLGSSFVMLTLSF